MMEMTESKAETRNNATIKHTEMNGEEKSSENDFWKKRHANETINKQRKEGRKTMIKNNNNNDQAAISEAESSLRTTIKRML